MINSGLKGPPWCLCTKKVILQNVGQIVPDYIPVSHRNHFSVCMFG